MIYFDYLASVQATLYQHMPCYGKKIIERFMSEFVTCDHFVLSLYSGERHTLMM